jgi:hypothetical protein
VLVQVLPLALGYFVEKAALFRREALDARALILSSTGRLLPPGTPRAPARAGPASDASPCAAGLADWHQRHHGATHDALGFLRLAVAGRFEYGTRCNRRPGLP